MSFANKFKHILGLDNAEQEEQQPVFPWEEDEPETPATQEHRHDPAKVGINMPRMVDALRRLYASLDQETRNAISDGKLPSLASEQPAAPERAEAPKTPPKPKPAEAPTPPPTIADAGREQKIKNLEQELEAARAEVKRLKELNSQLDTKSRMSDKMLSDLNRRAQEARAEADAMAQTVSDIKDLESKMELIDEKMAKKKARIAELTAENERLTAERDSLKKTVEKNLYNHAQNENALRRRIKELERGRGSSKRKHTKEETEPEPAPRRRSSLDEALSSTDWLDGVEHPQPEPTTKNKENDEQLSLF